ncbi:predicted protein [Aspergillus nidulans FGSC A4]|uniref:Uncharacterized protein n=1 Tax=Emericella nidulans (strain FGSC A4 / ATCC 38163 / CBS 112.46 / NRRL 194 / M139) TaxID=227321 RepID=Q5AVU8_EMENI|nr:hypothetical protein [Aspergillus nidulans FGSC A4]EAA62162.1 predicted protein [Aspergillus nidulans FGSC A4]CBF79674.1 TPA: conserved hypothetical protein [Aspergillus nidulans FGSC A4]|eukprot:XP_680851.1 predicted protein [Aspergillus nidulans FGSC A4]
MIVRREKEVQVSEQSLEGKLRATEAERSGGVGEEESSDAIIVRFVAAAPLPFCSKAGTRLNGISQTTCIPKQSISFDKCGIGNGRGLNPDKDQYLLSSYIGDFATSYKSYKVQRYTARVSATTVHKSYAQLNCATYAHV